MSKWTKWIPHTGDECPVDGDEVVRVKIPGREFDKAFRTFRASGWVWRNVSHFKRLKKNVEAERGTSGDRLIRSATQAREIAQAAIADDLSALKDRHETRRGPFIITDENVDATTTPIITGPGEYRMSNGLRATVRKCGSHFRGHVGKGSLGTRAFNVWLPSGQVVDGAVDDPRNITGPWTEDTADTKAETPPEKPERWANLYRHEDGKLHLGWTVRSTSEKVLGSKAADCAYKHIGTILLNPEEEG